MLTINEILEINKSQILNESGVRVPDGIKNAKILHHDDYDGLMSAVAIGMQLKKQGIDRIETGILHDRDTLEDQEKKLVKRKNQMLVVVDFDRFKDHEAADSVIDVQTDHHETDREREEGGSVKGTKSHKSVGKTQFASDVMHISSTKALGFIEGTDLSIMNNIDSAKFGKDVSTNIYLQKKLSENDGPQRKKMRLAIITSSILGQLVRGGRTVNPGAVKSIINNLIEQPSVINFYNQVRKHVNLQKEQVDLLKAFEGKESGEIDWEKIEEYNEKAPREMRIAIDRLKRVRKDKEAGRTSAASEEELASRNLEKQARRDLDIDPKTGEATLKSKDAGDADMKPWEIKDKLMPISKEQKSAAWKEAEQKARKKSPDFDNLSKEDQKKLIIPHWKKLMNELQKGAPGLLRKTENISFQSDMKGNRYLAYEDKKIAANIRDFWKFWQMAMRPDYYQRFIDAAKAQGVDFNPEEIDLVDLGRKALMMAKNEMFTIEELRRRGFGDPDKLLEQLNKAFDISYAKSGGHKAITNIDLGPIYGETADKYAMAQKRAKQLSAIPGKSEEKIAKLQKIEKTMESKSKNFGTFLREFKQRVQTLLTQAVQGRVTRTRKSLVDTMRQRAEQPIEPSQM